MWALMPMLRCRGPPSVLMYRAATALAAEDDARADARDDGAALRTAAEERPPKRPVDAAAAEAGRWANARRRRVAAAMMVVGVGRKEEKMMSAASAALWRFLVSAVLRLMADEGKTRTNTWKAKGKRGRCNDEEKGGAPAMSNGTVAVLFFFRAKRSRESEEPREAAPCTSIDIYPSQSLSSRSLPGT